MYLSIYLSTYLFYPSIHLSIYPSIHLSIYPSTHLPIYPSIYLSIGLSVCLSSYLSICKLENLAILRASFISQSWQHQKRSNSAWLPHFSKFATAKTKQFCDTSSFFETGQHQKRSKSASLPHFCSWQHKKTKQFCETSSFFWIGQHPRRSNSGRLLPFWNLTTSKQWILRDFLQKWKVECRADGLVPMCFAIFPVHLSKLLHLPRKSDARSYEVLHLSRKIIDLMLQPLSGNHHPDFLTVKQLRWDVSCTAPATENASLQIIFACPTPAIVFGLATKTSRFAHFWQGAQSLAPANAKRDLNVQKWSVHGVICTFWLENVLRATTACTFSTSQLPKVLRTWDVFSLANVLRATTVCTFSTSQLPKVVRAWCALYISTSTCASRHNGVHFFDISTSKVVRSWCALYILTSKCASRHNGVHFFIAHLARWLRNRPL